MENFNGRKMVDDSTVSLLHSLLGEKVDKAVEEGKVDITSCLVGDTVTKGAVNLFLSKVADLVTAHNLAAGMCGMDCNVTLTVENGVVSMHFSNVKEAPKAKPTPKVDPEVERKNKREQWVRKHYEDYLYDDAFEEGEVNQEKGVCSVVKIGKYTSTTYRAYCSPDDEWDFRIGVAVAYARAKGEQIPDFI